MDGVIIFIIANITISSGMYFILLANNCKKVRNNRRYRPRYEN